MATKKIAQTVITEDKFYTIAAANGSSGALCAPARACTASRTVSPAR